MQTTTTKKGNITLQIDRFFNVLNEKSNIKKYSIIVGRDLDS